VLKFQNSAIWNLASYCQ